MVGSFLNVVIHRLPIMMERAWYAEYSDYFGDGEETPPATGRYNLMVPRPAAPPLRPPHGALENIPLLSWLCLRGRCRNCHAPHLGSLSPGRAAHRPAVGLGSRAFPGWGTLAALLLTWTLVALTFIDLDKMLLPDQLTLPLLWGGLLFNLAGGFVPLADGWSAPWRAIWCSGPLLAFKLLTGKGRDGVWGFQTAGGAGRLAGLASLAHRAALFAGGAIIGIGLILLRNHHQGKPIPFGPYLAIAGWITLLWGDSITRWYLDVVL